MPYRLYITKMLDGYGDLEHFIERSFYAEKLLDASLRAKYPAKFILICNQSQQQSVIDKLSALPSDHPLYYNSANPVKNPNLHIIEGNDGLTVRNYIEKNFKMDEYIIHCISTPIRQLLSSFMNKINFIIYAGEHGHNTFDKEEMQVRCPFNRHMGFTELDNGIFTGGNNSVVAPKDFLKLPKTIQAKILDLDETALDQFTPSDLLAEFNKIWLVPAYVQSQAFFEQTVKTISQSPLAKEKNKKIVFFVTKNNTVKSLNVFSHQDNIRIVINDDYVNDKVFKNIESHEQYIHVCSGDKSLEYAFKTEKLPFFMVKGTKRKNFEAMIHIIKKIEIEDSHSKGKSDCLQFLEMQMQLASHERPRDLENTAQAFTEEACQFWCEIVVPYFKKNYSYEEKIPEIEHESIMLYEIINSENSALIKKHVAYFENKLSEEELLNLLLVAQFYKNCCDEDTAKAKQENFIHRILANLSIDKQIKIFEYYQNKGPALMSQEHYDIAVLISSYAPDPMTKLIELFTQRYKQRNSDEILAAIRRLAPNEDLIEVIIRTQSSLTREQITERVTQFLINNPIIVEPNLGQGKKDLATIMTDMRSQIEKFNQIITLSTEEMNSFFFKKSKNFSKEQLSEVKQCQKHFMESLIEVPEKDRNKITQVLSEASALIDFSGNKGLLTKIQPTNMRTEVDKLMHTTNASLLMKTLGRQH